MVSIILNQDIDVNKVLLLRDTALYSVFEMIEGEEPTIEALTFILGMKLMMDKLFSEYNDLPIGYDYQNLLASYERLQNNKTYQLNQ